MVHPTVQRFRSRKRKTQTKGKRILWNLEVVKSVHTHSLSMVQTGWSVGGTHLLKQHLPVQGFPHHPLMVGAVSTSCTL
jgi:hypothetical protein